MARCCPHFSTSSLPTTSSSGTRLRCPKQEPGLGDWLGGAFVSVPLVLLYLLVSSLIWQQLITYDEVSGELLSFADAWYFTVVSFTTVGYGDYLPYSQNSKRFFMFWCIISSLINFTVVSKFLSSVLVYKPVPEDNVNCEACGRPQLRHASKFFHVWPRLASILRWMVVLVMLLILGSYLIRETYKKKGTYLDWLDCWYWSFTTLTTVGYGDLVPQHQKVLFSFFFLVCVTVFCTVLAEIAGIVVDLDRFSRMETLLGKGFSKELMDVLDTNHDGKVTKLEFMMYVLDHLSIADMSEMEAICKVFDALDDDFDGELLVEQARRRLQRRVEAHHHHYHHAVQPPYAPERAYRSASSSAHHSSKLAKHAYRSDARPSHVAPSHHTPLLPSPAPPQPILPTHASHYGQPRYSSR